MKKNLVVIEELKKQGKALLDARRDNFVRQSLLSDEFLNFMQQNKKPFDLLMSYYECAIMEVETKFRVLNHELSLEYDNNPIESIKTRVKSYDSILKKIRRKNIPLNLIAPLRHTLFNGMHLLALISGLLLFIALFVNWLDPWKKGLE